MPYDSCLKITKDLKKYIYIAILATSRCEFNLNPNQFNLGVAPAKISLKSLLTLIEARIAVQVSNSGLYYKKIKNFFLFKKKTI